MDKPLEALISSFKLAIKNATPGQWIFSRSGANTNVQASVNLERGGAARVVLCGLKSSQWRNQLPGHLSNIPAGTKCDEHPGRDAIRRVQGETDSFGCEYSDMCQECHEEYIRESQAADYSGRCDWCRKSADRLIPHRDIEEGSCGRVYEVCKPCIDAERQRWDEENEYGW